MASSDRLTRLKAIRDGLEAELSDEIAAAASLGPKPSYSVGGKSVQWPAYREAMVRMIRDVNALVMAEEVPEVTMIEYSG